MSRRPTIMTPRAFPSLLYPEIFERADLQEIDRHIPIERALQTTIRSVWDQYKLQTGESSAKKQNTNSTVSDNDAHDDTGILHTFPYVARYSAKTGTPPALPSQCGSDGGAKTNKRLTTYPTTPCKQVHDGKL